VRNLKKRLKLFFSGEYMIGETFSSSNYHIANNDSDDGGHDDEHDNANTTADP
jgi:hypothetical protein